MKDGLVDYVLELYEDMRYHYDIINEIQCNIDEIELLLNEEVEL